MAEPTRSDEEVVRDLLEGLAAEEQTAPDGLTDKTIQKVRASITTRDLLDLSTVVFLLRFCAPLLDLVAAMLGQTLPRTDRRNEDE
jgi:hypothetical protein